MGSHATIWNPMVSYAQHHHMESFVVLCTCNPLASFGSLWNLTASPSKIFHDVKNPGNPKASHSMLGSILSYGTLCSPMQPFGVLWNLWNLMTSIIPYHLKLSHKSYGTTWSHVEPYVISCKPLLSHGILYYPMESYGAPYSTIWSPMGPHGIPEDPTL